MHDVGYHSYTACLCLKALKVLKALYGKVERFETSASAGLNFYSVHIGCCTKDLIRKDQVAAKFIEHPTTCTSGALSGAFVLVRIRAPARQFA